MQRYSIELIERGYIRKSISVALAIAVQSLIMFALWRWSVTTTQLSLREHEILLRLATLPHKVTKLARDKLPEVASRRLRNHTAPTRPSSVGSQPIAAEPPAGLRGFGQSLFACAPEMYDTVAPDVRIHCVKPGEGMTRNKSPDLMEVRSHVKDEAHWREEWAKIHEPSLLPCSGMMDVVCLLGKMADGSLSDYGDPAKWPADATKRLKPGDLHRVEQAFDDWKEFHVSIPLNSSEAK